ncbi:TPA: Rpn family recombination-promoting nuclease/putative transposase [Vibrio parahaemolyticus]
MTSNNPHDGLFKAFLTKPEVAKDFLDIHLPEHIRSRCDLTTLQLKSSSFLEEDLKPYYSDVLYAVDTHYGTGYVYTIVEHQSSPDFSISFRMMRYSIAAMQQHLDEGNKSLPLVVPLLFYHGLTSPHPYSMNWLELFAEPELAKALYSLPFPLVDITVISDDAIMGHRSVAALELVQKHARTRDMLEFVKELGVLFVSTGLDDSQVDRLVRYVLQVGESKNVPVLLEGLAQSAPEHGGTIMTIAEQLRLEGRQEGRLEGRKEGRLEERKDIARKMLLAGHAIELICDLTELSRETVAKLSN